MQAVGLSGGGRRGCSLTAEQRARRRLACPAALPMLLLCPTPCRPEALQRLTLEPLRPAAGQDEREGVGLPGPGQQQAVHQGQRRQHQRRAHQAPRARPARRQHHLRAGQRECTRGQVSRPQQAWHGRQEPKQAAQSAAPSPPLPRTSAATTSAYAVLAANSWLTSVCCCAAAAAAAAAAALAAPLRAASTGNARCRRWAGLLPPPPLVRRESSGRPAGGRRTVAADCCSVRQIWRCCADRPTAGRRADKAQGLMAGSWGAAAGA